MNINPYASPETPNSDRPVPDMNLVGSVGFYLSLTGVIALVAIPVLGAVAGVLAFAALPGLIVSCAGLIQRPRRLAAWGVAPGIFGTFCLPTMYQALSMATAR